VTMVTNCRIVQEVFCDNGDKLQDRAEVFCDNGDKLQNRAGSDL